MITLKCPQCPKTFTKPTEGRAKSALAMHIGRSHSKKINTPTGPRDSTLQKREEFLRKKREYNKRYREEHADRLKHLHKRAYLKRKTSKVNGTAQITDVLFNFCPKCGFHLQHAAIGIALAEKIKR